MSARVRGAALAAAAWLALGPASPAQAGGFSGYDLTGTWTGSIKCKSFDTGAKDKFTLDPTVTITQNGLALGIRVGTDQFVGLANPDAKKPLEKGELVVIHCGTNDQVGDSGTYDEIGRMTVATKPPKVKASFKGTSIFSDPGLIDAEVGTCKWKLTRTDAIDPAVPTSCPISMIATPPAAP